MKKGFIPAAYTPFNHDFSLNLAAISQISRLYVKQGITTVFINGTTGEFSSLTTRERELLAETWLTDSANLNIWVHVGHTSQVDAVRLAKHAQEHGADAISALAPYYFKPGKEELLLEFLAPIAQAASRLPFYYYHIPSLTGVELRLPQFISLARKALPNFVGVKYSSPDLYTLQLINIVASQSNQSQCDILFGVDEMLLGALPIGISGAIGSTYNFATPLYRRVIDAFSVHDIQEASKFQQLSASLVQLFHLFGGISTGKVIMDLLDVSCGPVRPPLPTLSAGEVKMIYDKIRHLDIFPHTPSSPIA